MDFNSLDFGQVPNNIYKRIVDSISPYRKDLRYLNGELLNAFFSMWLDDWIAAQTQSLVQFDSLQKDFIGLSFLAKGSPPMSRLAGVTQALHEMNQISRNDQQYWLDNFDAWRIMRYIDAPEMGAIDDFRATGVSQWHRDKQKELRGPAIQFLWEAKDWIERLRREHAMSFYLRPIFTFPMAQAVELRKAAMSGPLPDTSYYLSRGMRIVLESFTNNNIEYLFDGWNKTDGQAIRGVYWRWHYLTSYANIQCTYDDATEEWNLSPINIPPFFVGRPGTMIPIFSSQPYYGPLITESVQATTWVSLKSIDTPYNGQHYGIDKSIADLVFGVAAAATIVSLTTPTGTGQHKPTWTAAPFTKELLNLLPYFWTFLLKGN